MPRPFHLERSSYTGKELAERIHSQQKSRPPIIEGLVHERSVILNSSDPGSGKSIITAVIIAQSSSGLPVFGQLFVPKPVVNYYLPFERGSIEIEERFKHIEGAIPLNFDNIYVNERFIGMNVVNDQHADEIIANIHHDMKGRKIDILYIDPIYSAVAGGLSTDDKATLFTRFSSRLQAEFDCAIWMNHHTVKDSYNTSGDRIEKDDPFYGSQWLKAHCTGAYFMRRRKTDAGPTLFNKKDSHSCLLPQINLNYNPETYTVFMDRTDKDIPVNDRLIMYFRSLKLTNKKVTFEEIKGCLGGVSDSHLRNLLRTPPFDQAFSRISSSGCKTLYEATGVI